MAPDLCITWFAGGWVCTVAMTGSSHLSALSSVSDAIGIVFKKSYFTGILGES